MSNKLTAKDLEQKQQAARKHGTYAIRDRGSAAMTPTQRSRRAELVEQLETKAGIIEAMRDQAVDLLVMCGVAQSFVIGEHQAGKLLDEIKLLTALPKFFNATGRALKQYLDAMPDDSEVLDLAEHVRQAMNGNGNDP